MMQREASELATLELESPDLAELGLEEVVEEAEVDAEATEERTSWAGVVDGAWSLRSDGRRRADDEDEEEEDEVEDDGEEEEEEEDFDDDLDEDFDDEEFDDDDDDEEEFDDEDDD